MTRPHAKKCTPPVMRHGGDSPAVDGNSDSEHEFPETDGPPASIRKVKTYNSQVSIDGQISGGTSIRQMKTYNSQVSTDGPVSDGVSIIRKVETYSSQVSSNQSVSKDFNVWLAESLRLSSGRVTKACSSHSIHTLQEENAGVLKVACGVFPFRVFTLSLATACICVAVMQGVCDFLAAGARRQFPEVDTSSWPRTFCDFKAGQGLTEYLLHESVVFFCMVPRGMIMLSPCIIARRYEGSMSHGRLAALFSLIIVTALLSNLSNALIVTSEEGMLHNAFVFIRYLPEAVMYPALVTCILFRRGSVVYRTTLAGYVGTVVLSAVVLFAYGRARSVILPVACIAIGLFILFGTKTIVQKFPQPVDRRFDLGSQLLF